MSHRHTTEIAFLKAENDRLRRTIIQQHFVLESNASIAAAFAFDLVMWLSSRWWTRWLVAPVMKRMENAAGVAQASVANGQKRDKWDVGKWHIAGLLALLFSACGPQYAWRDRCDPVLMERVFIQCVQALGHGPSTLVASGNDGAEMIEECRLGAQVAACVREQYCYSGCEPKP